MKWKDYSSDSNSWEPEKNLTLDLIREFEAEKCNGRKRNGGNGQNSQSAGFDLSLEPEKILGIIISNFFSNYIEF